MIDVRPLERAYSDLAALSELHGLCFDDCWSASSLSSLLATPGCIGFLAAPKSVPDGFIVARVAADEVEVLTLAVRPECRRRGIGTALVSSSAACAQALGATVMFLEVGISNASARSLYAALGFSPVGERRGYYESGGAQEDAIILRANLPLDPLGKRPGLG